jgi:hypothetical protein
MQTNDYVLFCLCKTTKGVTTMYEETTRYAAVRTVFPKGGRRG